MAQSEKFSYRLSELAFNALKSPNFYPSVEAIIWSIRVDRADANTKSDLQKVKDIAIQLNKYWNSFYRSQTKNMGAFAQAMTDFMSRELVDWEMVARALWVHYDKRSKPKLDADEKEYNEWLATWANTQRRPDALTTETSWQRNDDEVLAVAAAEGEGLPPAA